MTLTVGELCAGYGGLGVAVEHVFDARLTWVSEYEDAPSKILRHHFPDVPNHGDMTKIDWHAVEPVDIISGGTPCQDLSAAGRRRGMTEGTRSNLWVQMRESIAIIRPRYVVWENVRGAYSATANSDVEFCPGCMGDAGDRKHLLRALGRVIGDLSDLGYDCQWRGIRASDVGAPHGRFRVFVLATHRDGGRNGWGTAVAGDGQGQEPDAAADRPAGRPGEPGPAETAGRRKRTVRNADGTDVEGQWAEGVEIPPVAVGTRERGSSGPDLADAQSFGGDELTAAAGGEGYVQVGGRNRGESVADTDSHAVGEHAGKPFVEETGADGGHGSGHPRGKRPAGKRGPAVADPVSEPGDERGIPAPGQTEAGRTSGESVRHYGTRLTAYTKSVGRGLRIAFDFIPSGGEIDVPIDQGPASTGTSGTPQINWGEYEPAIRRWESILRRPAPAPTEPTGRNGNHRLSARFAEWMMGMPDGWICDVPGVGRNDALKAAGNGVVPQQAAAALADMVSYSVMV